MSMKIGIVGAGKIGGTLVRKLRACGHAVRVANSRGPESLSGLAAETGATAVTTAEVAAGVDVLIVSVRFQQLTALKPLISAVASDITVVDTSNYLPVSGQPEQYGASPVEAIDAGQPETAWLQEQWGRPVIRAWNAQFAHTLADEGKAHGEPGRLALPVAGDSAESKQLVMRLVDDTGFDAVDAGTIAESWRQQMGSPAYSAELTADQLREALGLADREAAPKRRDATTQIISTWQDPSNFHDWLRFPRATARFPAANLSGCDGPISTSSPAEWGDGWSDSGRVFTKEDGTPLPDGWLSTRFAAMASNQSAGAEDDH
jgi:8-hydroxy-5-deazaflavin:NADPH oxidoreductase